MHLYFAPLEGITGYIYRNAYQDFYGGIDRYYSPFVVTRDRGIMKNKELKDILPENNQKITLIPQLLTNQSVNFIQAAKQMMDLGYKEINLNLGCPSGTVVSKGRGSGFLGRTLQLNRFLEEIFSSCDCDISIKTRIGLDDEEEFYELLKIYNQYPISELTIHPRTRQDFYKGNVHMDIFSYAYEKSRNPVCYNGDINTKEAFETLVRDYPEISAVMVGRGLIARPGFLRTQTAENATAKGRIDRQDKKYLQEFVARVLADYREVMSGDIHALFKMKEIWIYMAPHFTNYEKYLKKIKKTNKLNEYLVTVSSLFYNEDLKEEM